MSEVASAVARGGVVAFTGAGISAQSGIPTFRDPGGVWDRFDPAEFGTWDGLARAATSRPDELVAFLQELRRVFRDARPGPAHLALARLEAAGLVDAIVTQNVDGLHRDAGSRRLVEVHGTFRRTACVACGHREEVGREEFVEHLDRTILGLRTAFVPSLASLLPRCSRCGGPARPDFVAFGERLQGFEEAEGLMEGCRVLLVVGTSGEVWPAAALPERARQEGALVVDVSPAPTLIAADVRLEGLAGDVLPALADAVLGGR
ncbi:MAG TPA: Sir2 family NAD-dependent protein deacetylase [Actinomycetota bacterium]|nr:Sir2 family NAD-dependent protein deacetylase [Actinomycetota bacterium]